MSSQFSFTRIARTARIFTPEEQLSDPTDRDFAHELLQKTDSMSIFRYSIAPMNSLVHTIPTSTSPQPSGSQHWSSMHKAPVRQINSPTNLLTARVSRRTCRIICQRPGAALAASPQDSISTPSATGTLPAQLVLPSPEPRKLRRGDLVEVECMALAFGGQVCR